MAKIMCKYQYWGPSGITWTSEYLFREYETEAEAKEECKRLNDLEKKNKMKHEYTVN